jgi:hypothetical protein
MIEISKMILFFLQLHVDNHVWVCVSFYFYFLIGVGSCGFGHM